MRERVRQWRRQNREEFLASNRASKKKYYARNREALIAWQHEYTARNYERLRNGWLDYAASHREAARERARLWRVANPERVAATAKRRRESGYWRQPQRRAKAKEWVNKNREKVRDTLRASRHKRRAQGGPSFTAAQWREILELWKHSCAYCGATGSLEVEHTIPLARGGTSAKENVVPACHTCNGRKKTMTEDEFRLLLILERDPLDVPYNAQ